MGVGIMGLTLLGAGLGAYGQYEQGQAQGAAAHYQAGVQRINAAIARQNAAIAMESGNAQVGIQQQKTRATIAATKASEGASGVDVNSGSFRDVISSERALGELDAMNVRTNAVREAYGLNVRAKSEEAQATLSEFESKNAKAAGTINAATTLIGGIADSESQWAKFKMAGGAGQGFAG